jgi:hypothetical protein
VSLAGRPGGGSRLHRRRPRCFAAPMRILLTKTTPS